MRFSDVGRNFWGGTRPARRGKRGRRRATNLELTLEGLEHRLVMSTSTWTGASATVSNWSATANWNVLPSAGSDLIFPAGASRLSNTNDFLAGTPFGSITYQTGGYTTVGNAIAVATSIDSAQTTGSNSLNTPIALGLKTPVTVDHAGSIGSPNSLTLGGVISGPGGVDVKGAGTVILSATDTNTGATTVDGGTLLVNGSLASSAVTVNTGATLGGTGTVAAIDDLGGIVQAGSNGVGILTDKGALSLATGSTVSTSLNGATAGTGYGQFDVGGPTTIAGTTLKVSLGFTPTLNETFTLLKNTSGSAITGTFTGLAEGATTTVNGFALKISYVGGAGHDIVLTNTTAPNTTSTALTASSTSISFGQSVTLTATVTSTAGGTPTGSVQFFAGTTSLGTVNLSGDVATLATTSLPVGSDSVTAVYSGAPGFPASTSPSKVVSVSRATSTTTVTGTPNPAVFGQTVTLTATVASGVGGSGTPTGTIQFESGTTSLGSVNLSGGVGSLTTSTLPLGDNSITAVYAGDTNFVTSVSAPTTEAVNSASTTSTITISPTQPTLGQSVTLTATVVVKSPGAGIPTGTVQFLDGLNSIGSGVLSNGVATLTTTALTGGSNVLTVNYPGDTDFSTSTSSPLTVTVAQAASSTSLTVSPNPAASGGTITLVATVIPASSTVTIAPTGTVTFFSNGVSLGTGTISSNVASFSTTLPIGNSTLTASYGGDTNFTASKSQPVTEAVTLASAVTTVTASNTNPGSGSIEVLTATVSAGSNGVTPTGTVSFFNFGTFLGSATLASGTGTLTLKGLALGVASITASFSGDANTAPGTSAPLVLSVGIPIEQYINDVYQQLLHRPVDAAGLEFWLGNLTLGGSHQHFVNALIKTAAHRQAQIGFTYGTILNRFATASELASGSRITNVALQAKLYGSDEFLQNSGGTNDSFLSALGEGVLGMPLSAAQVTTFTNELNRGTSRTTVARQLLQSFSGESAQVNQVYTSLLGRSANSKELATGVSSLSRSQSIDAVLGGVLASAEFNARVVATSGK
jgi:trimeric autotransporter adhesin